MRAVVSTSDGSFSSSEITKGLPIRPGNACICLRHLCCIVGHVLCEPAWCVGSGRRYGFLRHDDGRGRCDT